MEKQQHKRDEEYARHIPASQPHAPQRILRAVVKHLDRDVELVYKKTWKLVLTSSLNYIREHCEFLLYTSQINFLVNRI